VRKGYTQMRRVSWMVAAVVLASGAFSATAVADTSPPGNLGNGLGRLVAPPRAKAGVRLTQAPLTIRDRQGRVLVNVYAAKRASFKAVRARARAAGLKAVTVSTARKAIEGFVAIRNIRALAKTRGVASVAQALRPYTKVGAATSQGVQAQRVDRVPAGIDGRGITVGALSDSFDLATETVDGAPLTVHAADDIRTGDLPPDGVTVLEDSDQGADEGRAMLQIVHDIAPAARECFATAFNGDLGFASNIRALADRGGRCKADVIVDDVGYFDEPFYGRGPITDAVDAVAAQGVHYFSSAGNGSSQQAYRAPLRIVAPGNATRGSNIDLTGVDPALYAGGFHDFRAGSGLDIAQDVALGGVDNNKMQEQPGDGILDLQWDDPVDPNGAPLGPALLQTTGEITAAAPVASIPFTGTAGQTIQAVVDAIPSGSTDFILTLKDPAGNVLQKIDTATSPETVVQTLPVTGTYTFQISGFNGDLGDFTFEVRPVLGNSRTTTDLNALFFDANGHFLFAASDLNKLSGKPFEIAGFEGSGPLQLVIAKGNTDPGQATELRYEMFDGLQSLEYVQPLAPAISGHPLARGATAVAAYDPFRPLLPEDYTSVGGNLPIKFDSAGNRLPQPDIRRAPQVAATDGGNTTFFVRDSALDPDTQPNFFGTSASAPHAAAIGALVLQAKGGPASLGPDALRSLLERSAFPHDLDQQHSGAAKDGLTITANGPYGDERRPSRPRWTTTGAMTDPRFFKVSYHGEGSLDSIRFDGLGANPTGLGTGPLSSGLVFDPRPFVGIPALGGPPLYEQGFPFTVGAVSPGIARSDVSAAFALPGVGQANGQQYGRMTVSFAPGKLRDGRSVAFGIDRDEAVTAYGIAQDGNSADQLGRGVLFPSGDTVGPGLLYTAKTSTGRTLVGRLRNRIGAGWTRVDGYGYLNAEAAVAGAR
jgi:Subtilase family